MLPNTVNRKIALLITIATTLMIGACKYEKAKSKQAGAVSDSSSSAVAKPVYGTVNTWIDDFKNFRTAVYQKDISKMETYFNFPVPTDNTQIWDAVYVNTADSKRPQAYPTTFTQADLKKYNRMLFTDAFAQSLLKVKSEQLYQKGEYTTAHIKEGGQNYYLVANYIKEEATLQLSIMYTVGTDENGEEISEGESATIYFFKVENNKYLKFDKILFAG